MFSFAMSSFKGEVDPTNTSTPSIVHREFNDFMDIADITLVSCDNTTFQIHSTALCAASGWFRRLPSLAQSPSLGEKSVPAQTITMPDTAKVLDALISIILWEPLPTFDTIDLVDDLLRAGEKYQIPTVVSIMRLAIISPHLIDAHPIRIYGLASLRGWTAEAKLASTKTIGRDLLSPESIAELASVEFVYMTKLMLLHRQRRDKFYSALQNTTVFIMDSAHLNASKQCSYSFEQLNRQAMLRKWAWWGKIKESPGCPSTMTVHSPDTYELLETHD